MSWPPGVSALDVFMIGKVGFMLCAMPRKIPKQRGELIFVDPEK